MRYILSKYLTFLGITLLVVLPLELLFSPHHRKTIAEYGLPYFMRTSLLSMIFLFALISLLGLIIFLRGYTPKKMGILSLVLGFAIEFLFMKPDWASAITRGAIKGGTLVAVFLSAIYWFAVWYAPSYGLQSLNQKGTLEQ